MREQRRNGQPKCHAVVGISVGQVLVVWVGDVGVRLCSSWAFLSCCLDTSPPVAWGGDCWLEEKQRVSVKSSFGHTATVYQDNISTLEAFFLVLFLPSLNQDPQVN